MLSWAWPWMFVALPLPWLAARLFAPARSRCLERVALAHRAARRDRRRWRRARGALACSRLHWRRGCCWLRAAARPQWLGEPEATPRTGRDLLLAVDASGSMSTEDMSIGGRAVSRYGAVKTIAGDFIRRRTGDRIGLIVFGSQAYLLTPLTFDRDTVLKQLKDSVVGLPGRQTAIGDAVGLAVKRLQNRPRDQRVLILLTDGVNDAGELDPYKSIDLALAEHVKIYTIGIGADSMRVDDFFGSHTVQSVRRPGRTPADRDGRKDRRPFLPRARHRRVVENLSRDRCARTRCRCAGAVPSGRRTLLLAAVGGAASRLRLDGGRCGAQSPCLGECRAMSVFFSNFHFLRPWWLLALVALPLIWRALSQGRSDAGAWRGVVDEHLLPHLLVRDDGVQTSSRSPRMLAMLAFALACLALAGPAWEQLPQPLFQNRSARVIALELSATMQAQDVTPSRFERARFKIADILQRNADGQTALIAYAGEPFVVAPLTDDVNTVSNLLDALEPTVMPVQGNNTGKAMEMAASLIRGAGLREGEILLLADAVGDGAETAVRRARAQGIRVSVIGVGSAQGAPVPLQQGGFLKNGSGEIVLPKLDNAALAGIGAGWRRIVCPDQHGCERSRSRARHARCTFERRGRFERSDDDALSRSRTLVRRVAASAGAARFSPRLADAASARARRCMRRLLPRSRGPISGSGPISRRAYNSMPAMRRRRRRSRRIPRCAARRRIAPATWPTPRRIFRKATTPTRTTTPATRWPTSSATRKRSPRTTTRCAAIRTWTMPRRTGVPSRSG